jgi:hypothetical protein
MSCHIVIATGLTKECAYALDRRAQPAGAPFTFLRRRRRGFLRRRHEVVVQTELADAGALRSGERYHVVARA